MVALQSNLDAAAAAAGTDPVMATFFGIPVILPAAGYLQSVVPIVLACALLAPLEKYFKRVIPEVIRGVFAPMLSLLITCAATVLVVGPVANTLSNLIAQGRLAILSVAPAIGGAAIAFAWPGCAFAAAGSIISIVSGARNATGLISGASGTIDDTDWTDSLAPLPSLPALPVSTVVRTKATFPSPGTAASRNAVRRVGAPGSVFCWSR